MPKKGGAGSRNKLWRIHAAYDLPEERFGHFELTDESEGETLDRIPVAAGDILLADRGYLQAGRMAGVLAAGADFIIRAGWKSASWQGADGEAFDLITALAVSSSGIIDQPVWLKPRTGPALALRLVAVRKPLIEAEKARAKARRASQRGGHAFSGATLVAADWVILITSLAAPSFTAADVLGLYRLRWRVELGFKRLKSVVGLAGPPGADPRSARPYILAHLLMILLLEPLVDELGDSPRLVPAG